jgi:hypothetical protein
MNKLFLTAFRNIVSELKFIMDKVNNYSFSSIFEYTYV